MTVRPADLAYAVDEVPPWPRLLPLAFQYAVLIAVYLILVIIVARSAGASDSAIENLVALGLVAAAVGTVAQSYNGRLFGSGYLAPPVYSAIYLAPAILAAKVGGLPAVAGMTIFAGLVEVVLSQLLSRLRVVFQPTISGFTILIVGIQLGIVGIGQTLDVPYEGVKGYPLHVLVALITLGVSIALTIWGRGVFKLTCSLIGLIAGLIAALAVGLIGPASIAMVHEARWLALPDPTGISYGFHLSLVPTFIAAGFAATLRTIGVVTSTQQMNDAEWKRPDMDNIARGVVGDAIGCIAGGVVGVLGMSSAPSLVGVSRATDATSRVIGYAAAVILLGFAAVPKFAASIVILPTEIAGAFLVFTSSFLIIAGIQIIAIRGLDLRSGFAISIALFLGLLTLAQPAYFASLPGSLRTIASDMMTVSLATAIGLTLLFRLSIRQRDVATWQDTDAALAEFGDLITRESKNWKLAEDVVDRSREVIGNVVRHLKDGRFLDAPVAIEASSDGIELLVELVYRGRPMALPIAAKHQETAHEEAAAAEGLKAFAGGVHADRVRVAVHKDEVTIQMWFEL